MGSAKKKSKYEPKPQREPEKLDPLCVAVRQVRLARRETQEAFARRIHVSMMTVSKFETGRLIPRGDATLTSLLAAAFEAGCEEEARVFAAAEHELELKRRAVEYPRTVEVKSRQELRLLTALAHTIQNYPERIPTIEAVLKPALEYVDQVMALIDIDPHFEWSVGADNPTQKFQREKEK
jgi:transcriptional regulator with XRE-family HTH domain